MATGGLRLGTRFCLQKPALPERVGLPAPKARHTRDFRSRAALGDLRRKVGTFLSGPLTRRAHA